MPARPKPNNILKLRGSRHADESRAPRFPLTDKPKPPPFLSSYAQAEWTKLVRDLKGIITAVDLGMLTVLADSLGEVAEASEHLRAEGTVIAGERGPMVNPWLRIRNAAAERARKVSLEFGITPASRGKVKTTPPLVDDEGAEFFARAGSQ